MFQDAVLYIACLLASPYPYPISQRMSIFVCVKPLFWHHKFLHCLWTAFKFGVIWFRLSFLFLHVKYAHIYHNFMSFPTAA